MAIIRDSTSKGGEFNRLATNTQLSTKGTLGCFPNRRRCRGHDDDDFVLPSQMIEIIRRRFRKLPIVRNHVPVLSVLRYKG